MMFWLRQIFEQVFPREGIRKLGRLESDTTVFAVGGNGISFGAKPGGDALALAIKKGLWSMRSASGEKASYGRRELHNGLRMFVYLTKTEARNAKGM